jgi:hypothetical protein
LVGRPVLQALPGELHQLLEIEISIRRHRHDRDRVVHLDRPEYQRFPVVAIGSIASASGLIGAGTGIEATTPPVIARIRLFAGAFDQPARLTVTVKPSGRKGPDG